MHAAELWGEEGLASKVRAWRQLQAVQRSALRKFAELRAQAQRRGLMSTCAPALDAEEQRDMVDALADATRAVIESSDAALAAMGAALPDVSERTKELRGWSLSLVEGTRTLITLGQDVSGVPALGEAWRKARACSDRPAGTEEPRRLVICRTNGPVHTTKWSPAAQQWAGDARVQARAAQERAAAEAFERQPPGEILTQLFHDVGAARAAHNWQTPLQKAAAAAGWKAVAKLRAQQGFFGDASTPAAAPAAPAAPRQSGPLLAATR